MSSELASEGDFVPLVEMPSPMSSRCRAPSIYVLQTQLGRRHSPGPLPPYGLERSGSLYIASRSDSQCETLPEDSALEPVGSHFSGGPMGCKEILLQVMPA